MPHFDSNIPCWPDYRGRHPQLCFCRLPSHETGAAQWTAVDSSSSAVGEADTDTDCYKCMRGLRGYDQCYNAAHVAEFDLISLLLHGVRGTCKTFPYTHILWAIWCSPLNADWLQKRCFCFKAQWVGQTTHVMSAMFDNDCCTILGEVLVQVHANAKFLRLEDQKLYARLATATADWNCKLS